MSAKQHTTIIAAIFLLLVGLSSLSIAQGMGSERELCLQDCRQWISEYGGFGGGSRGIGDAQARLYARCVERCERRFWKEFDKEFGEQ